MSRPTRVPLVAPATRLLQMLTTPCLAERGSAAAVDRDVSVSQTARMGTRNRVANRWLGIYLRDHYAASAGGVALARRALGPHHPVAAQIAQDRATLEDVMRQLGVEPSQMKVRLVQVAERLGRLKPNGRLFGRSPLTPVVELEVLVAGIRAKEALWTALLRAEQDLPRVDLEALAESARAQARAVDEQRLSAGTEAFR